MDDRTYTIKPGLLVGLKTRLDGGVTYSKSEESETRVGDQEYKTWKTDKHVENVDELEAASKLRGKASSLIRGACIKTQFGLLCPEGNERKLRERQREALDIIARHNADATCTRIDLYVITGRVASDDRDAVRAIFSDIGDAVQAIRAGIRDLKPEAIREAASRAKAIGAMLDPDQEERVSAAVKAARKAARQIVKIIGDKTEIAEGQAAQIRSQLDTAPISAERFAFLDLDQTPAECTPAEATAAAELYLAAEAKAYDPAKDAADRELFNRELDLAEAENRPVAGPDLFAPAPVAGPELEV